MFAMSCNFEAVAVLWDCTLAVIYKHGSCALCLRIMNTAFGSVYCGRWYGYCQGM
jgi:hypothetical protein